MQETIQSYKPKLNSYLDELLEDNIAKLIMRRDNVTEAEVREIIWQVKLKKAA